MSTNQVPWLRSAEGNWSYLVAQHLTETPQVGWFQFLTSSLWCSREKPVGRGLLSCNHWNQTSERGPSCFKQRSHQKLPSSFKSFTTKHLIYQTTKKHTKEADSRLHYNLTHSHLMNVRQLGFVAFCLFILMQLRRVCLAVTRRHPGACLPPHTLLLSVQDVVFRVTHPRACTGSPSHTQKTRIFW